MFHNESWRKSQITNNKEAALWSVIIMIAYYENIHLLSATGRYTPSAANQILSARFSRTPQTCANFMIKMLELLMKLDRDGFVYLILTSCWPPAMRWYFLSWLWRYPPVSICRSLTLWSCLHVFPFPSISTLKHNKHYEWSVFQNPMT